MKVILRYILIISLLSLLIRCDKEEVTSRSYPRLKTLPVSEITSMGVRFNAEITFRGNSEVLNYGFVWSEKENPTIESSEKVVHSYNIQSNSFSANIGSTLNDSISYFVRSFLRTNDFLVYGQNVQFTSLGGVAPQLFLVDPSEAYRGETVTIKGKGFSYQENIIYFDHFRAQIISNSDSSIRVIVPEELTSFHPKIEIELLNRKSELTNSFKLLGPTLSNISDYQGIIGRDIITIESDSIIDESNNYLIEVNGEELEIEITNLDNGSISFYIPPNSPVGEYSINLIKDSERFINPISFKFISPWIRKSDLPGSIFGSYGSTFVINDKIYFANSTNTDDKDFWQYDPITDDWQQKADIPGPPYTMRIAFTLANKGYIGTGDCVAYYCSMGISTSSSVLSYDHNSDTWESLSYINPDPFEINEGAFGAIGFSVNDVGYMFGGYVDWDYAHHYNYWKYDYTTDNWSVINEFNDFKSFNYLINPTGFVINGKIYLGLGQINYNYEYTSNFWEYDPNTDTWKQISDFPGTPRSGAVGFTKNEKGYVGLGYNSSHGKFKDFWTYDPINDTWRRIADLPSSAREGAVSAEVNNRAFVGFGTQSNDLWEFE